MKLPSATSRCWLATRRRGSIVATLSITVLAVAGFACDSKDSPTEDSQVIDFEPRLIDLGVLTKLSKESAVPVKITNRSNRALSIWRAGGGCGCIEVALPELRGLDPRGSATIYVSLNKGLARPGSFEYPLTVITTAGGDQYESSQCRVSFRFAREVEIDPGQLVFESSGETKRAITITLSGDAASRVDHLSFKSPHPRISIESGSFTADPGSGTKTIDAVVDVTSLGLQSFNGDIVVLTQPRTDADLRVPIRFVDDSGVKISPSFIDFKAVSSGRASSRRLVGSSADGREFRFLSARMLNDEPHWLVTVIENGQTAIVVLDAGSVESRLNGMLVDNEVVVDTSHGTYHVPVMARITR